MTETTGNPPSQLPPAQTSGGCVPLVLAGTPEARERLATILSRGGANSHAAEIATVQAILDAVRAEGDPALVRFTRDLDRVELTQAELRVERGAALQAFESLSPEQRAALEAAAANIRRYQQTIFQEALKLVTGFGRQVEMRLQPMRQVGLYIPGGRAAYPSTVLMTAIPARVAGVERIVVVTPPDDQGQPRQEVLAACHLAGIDEIYRMGGAEAIAALAYGTATVAPVDFIAGPGNRYVTCAKRLVYGTVGIDALAGPTEVVLIADDSARADWIAADLLAQAEHDPDAACVLLTAEAELAAAVVVELDRQLGSLPTAATCRAALARYGLLMICSSLDEACDIAEQLAPEHLELHTRSPELQAARVPSAAAIFMGAFTPEATGDYLAGPSHVLPTGRAARYSSGLSVFDFLLRRNRIAYQREGLLNERESLTMLARLEGFEAHARSIEIRLNSPA